MTISIDTWCWKTLPSNKFLFYDYSLVLLSKSKWNANRNGLHVSFFSEIPKSFKREDELRSLHHPSSTMVVGLWISQSRNGLVRLQYNDTETRDSILRFFTSHSFIHWLIIASDVYYVEFFSKKVSLHTKNVPYTTPHQSIDYYFSSPPKTKPSRSCRSDHILILVHVSHKNITHTIHLSIFPFSFVSFSFVSFHFHWIIFFVYVVVVVVVLSSSSFL